MKSKVFNASFLLLVTLIIVASLSRLLTNQFHIWNFSPVAAMALFSGAYFRNKSVAFVVPLIAMVITDAIIGFYPGIWVVYAAFLVITCVGFLLQNRIRIIPVIVASLSSSIIFFILTNFALFYPTTLYPHTLQGIIDSYVAAIPFFGNTVIGDLFYCCVLFGGYELIKRFYPAVAKAG